MNKQHDYLTQFFDIIVSNYKNYPIFFKENYGVIVLIITILGGLNQIINFLLISPSIIVYYSPQQGLLDGVLFLSFVFLTASFFFILSIWFFQIGRTEASSYGNYIFSIAILLSIIILLICVYNQLFLLGFYWGFGLLLTTSLIRHGEIRKNSSFKASKHQDDNAKIREKKEENRLISKFALTFIVISFSVYFATMQHSNKISSSEIYNIEIIQRKLNIKYSANYEAVYNNGEHVFFKDYPSGKCIVLDSDIITKITLEK